MSRSKLYQSVLAFVLTLLVAAFIFLWILDGTLSLPGEAVLPLGFVFFLLVVFSGVFLFGGFRLKEKQKSIGPELSLGIPTVPELIIMIALVMAVCFVATRRLSSPPFRPGWLVSPSPLKFLVPLWGLPAFAIVVFLLCSALLFGLHRDAGKIKLRSALYKLEVSFGLGFLALAIVLFSFWAHSNKDSYPFSFDGDSDQLKQTVVVPTIDTPIPKWKSAIWCASFQMAWNQLRSVSDGGPLQIEGAEAVADRLNHAEVSQSDLDPEAYYAAGGLVRGGIAETVQREMARRFAKAPCPEFVNAESAIAIAYAFLQAQVKFDHPYVENQQPFVFEELKGPQVLVKSFGISGYLPAERIRSQVELLYSGGPKMMRGEPSEYALDLCKDSSPNQVVLALIQRKESLKEALKDLDTKMAQYPPQELENQGYRGYLQQLRLADTLLVPNMHFRLAHHFHELEGSDKRITNGSLAGLYIGDASQTIQFKLDRSGVSLSSEASLAVFAAPRDFLFNRPFLIYMKKRGAKHPFFVMWVDNAELLIKN
jgi:hypothetical protein